MDYWKLPILLLSILISIGFGDINDDPNPHINYEYPINNGISPEKQLPNEPVFDSHEPRYNNPSEEWWQNRNLMVSISAVFVMGLYIISSRACCIKVSAQPIDEFPLKAWSVKKK
eukprot:28022_1